MITTEAERHWTDNICFCPICYMSKINFCWGKWWFSQVLNFSWRHDFTSNCLLWLFFKTCFCGISKDIRIISNNSRIISSDSERHHILQIYEKLISFQETKWARCQKSQSWSKLRTWFGSIVKWPDSISIMIIWLKSLWSSQIKIWKFWQKDQISSFTNQKR